MMKHCPLQFPPDYWLDSIENDIDGDEGATGIIPRQSTGPDYTL